MKSIAQEHDCLLIDLDGTVFCGRQPTGGAVQSLSQVRSRKLFVTNNASRSADEVAAHLCELGFTATGEDVVTSAQSAAHLLAGQLAPGARVLIVGTEALANEVAAVGLRPVRRFEDRPDAVVQGLSMTTGWSDLAEAALAIRAGALWVAANVDPTLPTERGLLPGNGSMVAALRTATGMDPRVAGKPAPALMTEAVAGHDLRSLHQDSKLLAVAPQPGWQIDVGGGAVTVCANGDVDDLEFIDDGLSIVRAVASAVWEARAADLHQRPLRIEAGDERARAALQRWSLMRSDHPVTSVGTQ